MPKVAEKAPSNAFHIGFESTDDGLKTAPVDFEERVLTKTSQNDAQDETINRNIEC